MTYLAMKKAPLEKTSGASILVAWGGIEPPTQGFSIRTQALQYDCIVSKSTA
ncbi:hypothetical protein [Rhodoferax antarcticus]|uniref:Uncharacterized protein n=1 Tax=Rhodoferax antarcticus ANT.BR TaxID=1111071 RepID=A0A1Q8YG54_9BURK|nr:hypothetical protein [Rhodoferax antarcticus]MCW2314260.1 hypothetical protein [Rhodoferax antarcticus]OLP06975.1 hypothetical protein BLL52_1721 [Rhodoferax antarcticus ANT.BR]